MTQETLPPAASEAIWLFDLGNSRLKCAPLGADGRPGALHALAHDGTRFDAALDDILPAHCEAAYVASVAAPALRVRVLDALSARCGRIVRPCTLPALAGVRIAYADPASLGVDRFLALLAARARGPGAWLVVGVGTALTIDLLDADGRHRGGRIAPSPALMRASLHARAAQLPETGGTLRAFADNTPDALRSGCDGAALALIERAQRDAFALLGSAPRLLLHGGGAAALAQRPASADHADAVRADAQHAGAQHAEMEHADVEHADALVLEGVAVWAAANSATAPQAAAPGAAHTMPAC